MPLPSAQRQPERGGKVFFVITEPTDPEGSGEGSRRQPQLKT